MAGDGLEALEHAQMELEAIRLLRDSRIVHAYRVGVERSVIAELVGIPKAEVTAVLRAEGIEPERPGGDRG